MSKSRRKAAEALQKEYPGGWGMNIADDPVALELAKRAEMNKWHRRPSVVRAAAPPTSPGAPVVVYVGAGAPVAAAVPSGEVPVAAEPSFRGPPELPPPDSATMPRETPPQPRRTTTLDVIIEEENDPPTTVSLVAANSLMKRMQAVRIVRTK
ncbi:hypothetical protein HDV05_004856 [Chytridiales sp. JEL 0842]|nr:hypothetical protein HDV05_004856 [Chytridiales sp. JEL 0842]